MTFLEAVNYVLQRLRESSVSAYTSSDYSRLVGSLVNSAKREVEDAHEWHTLRETITGSIVASDTDVTFTGTSDRTRIIAVYNDTEEHRMWPKPRNQIIKYRNEGTTQSGRPDFYALKGYDSAGEMELELWPDSDGSYDLILDCINPQADLANNTTRISVPGAPVALRALALAIAERGEDGGQPFQQVMSEYSIALTDAVNRDKDNGPYHEAWYVP
jgi:hypothetical protein